MHTCFWDRVSPSISSCSRAHYVDQVCLVLTEIHFPASSFWMLGLNATTPSLEQSPIHSRLLAQRLLTGEHASGGWIGSFCLESDFFFSRKWACKSFEDKKYDSLFVRVNILKGTSWEKDIWSLIPNIAVVVIVVCDGEKNKTQPTL